MFASGARDDACERDHGRRMGRMTGDRHRAMIVRSVRVAAAGFSIARGTPKSFIKQGDSGRPVTRFFCGDCGSPLYTLPPLHPEVVFIKAGSLDDPTLVVPDRQAWTRSRVTWAEIDPAIASYETNRT